MAADNVYRMAHLHCLLIALMTFAKSTKHRRC